MNSAQIPNAEPAGEFLFEAPDEIHRVLLIEIARGHGLPAFVRPRSRRRVWVRGAKAEVDAVAATARRLAPQLQVLQLEAVFKVLVRHNFVPSLHLAKLISLVEGMAATASAQKPPTIGGRTAPRTGERHVSEKSLKTARLRPAP